jgi:membrane protease YdiL (CAAX protease family)
VHYRGLARRVSGRPATPLFPGVGLLQGWTGLTIAVCVPILATIAMEPHAVATLFGGQAEMAPGMFFRAMAWSTAFGLACALPIARRIGFGRLAGDWSTLRASWRILVAWGLLITVGAITAWFNTLGDANGAPTEQTRMIDSLIGGGLDTYGLAATLLLAAVLVPIFEETVFRGLLLGGLTRHVSFGWANVMQATLFALAHNDLPRFPFYLTMGLLAGWLVRKTRALGPAIGLHVLNNAVATLIHHWH